MIDQREAIINEDWDFLLILDACRYDYFERIFEEYLTGDLKKANSPVSPEHGVATSDWCKKIFPGNHDDIVYVSTTPVVNSKLDVHGFSASEHFFKVVDLWKQEWNEKAGTVFPEKVNENILKTKRKYPEKRIIAHYLQPHFPYLGSESPMSQKNIDPKSWLTLKRKLRNFFGSRVRRILGGKWTRKLMEFLRLPPPNPMHEVLRRLGPKGLKEAYAKNLHEVLSAVAEVSDSVSGKIVVTSDHGEYLGEEGFYGHSYLPEHPVLKMVPWFKLKE